MNQNQWSLEPILISLIAIVLGLGIGAIIMLLGGYDPLAAYGSLLKASFGNRYRIGETIRQITPLIFTGLSVAFAFRTGLFNIGAEGQFVIGSLAAAYAGVAFPLPGALHLLAALLTAGLAAG